MASCTPDRYESRHYISECDCDFALRLTAGGLLRLVQEVSTRHCTLLGDRKSTRLNSSHIH